jgi:hypothetical protein
MRLVFQLQICMATILDEPRSQNYAAMVVGAKAIFFFMELTGREASTEGSQTTLRPGQTRTDLGSESIGEKRFKGDTKEQYEADKIRET